MRLFSVDNLAGNVSFLTIRLRVEFEPHFKQKMESCPNRK